VAQLIVRNLDPELVVELRRRAAESGRSAEAEHRELLRSALKWTGVSCPCRQVQRGNTK
jgi:plasmid stability protein